MKKKIFTGVFCGILSILCAGLFSLIFMIEKFEIKQSFGRLEGALSEILSLNLSQIFDKDFTLNSSQISQNLFLAGFRLSLIKENGEIFYDSFGEISQNHLDRKEVQNALKKPDKIAFSKRISATLNENLLYAAKFTKINGENFIVRLSEKKPNFVAILRNFAPFLITLFFGAIILSVILAQILSRKIIAPIDKIDLSHPIKTNPYKELEIFMRRIAKQKKKIKKQVRRLRINQHENEALMAHISEGFLLFDSALRLRFLNEKAANLLEISQGNELFENEILRKFKPNLNALILQESVKNTSFECDIKGIKFEIIALSVWIKGKFKALILIMVDISAKVKAANLRREFSANVSHELKTPLSVIMASSEMLKNNLVAKADEADFVNKIYAESKRLLSLIDKILLLSFLDENSPNSLKSTLDLNEIIKRVQKNLSLFAKKRNVKIITKSGAKPCKITGVSALIEDMIYNLAQNAIKYSFKGGKIWLDAEISDKKAILRVKDEGVGIDKSEHERIFERFYRVDKSRSKKIFKKAKEFENPFGNLSEDFALENPSDFKNLSDFEDLGSGLGLSIVKNIARIHNAKITLQSELNKGTIIIVEFEI